VIHRTASIRRKKDSKLKKKKKVKKIVMRYLMKMMMTMETRQIKKIVYVKGKRENIERRLKSIRIQKYSKNQRQKDLSLTRL